uniref:Uncharacterized protein n=1 Tax=Arundo donax TaxID=35708 RepID=A0A0A9DBR2_ARUDO
MDSKPIFHAMHFDSGVEDAEAEPVEVVVEGGDIVDVEVHLRRRRPVVVAAAAVVSGGGRGGGALMEIRL